MTEVRISRLAALAALLPMVCAAQEPAARPPEPIPNPPKSTVYVNPRSGSDDPRVGLKGGLYDAAEAIFGFEKMASLPKPPGFAPGDSIIVPAPPPPPPMPGEEPRPPQGNPNQYGSTNSDMAFSGNHLFVGNYNGINTYDIDNPGKVKLRTSLVCPGGQGDVSVYGHLMFMSAEAVNGRTDCGTTGIPLPAGYVEPAPTPAPPPAPGEAPGRPRRPPPPPSPDRFRGVRIFDISDIGNPKQVAAVQSCRGSHTHTLVLDPKDKENVYIYISGTGQVRQSEELAGCSGEAPDKDPNTSLFRIDIIKVPLAHPEQAKIVSQPRIFADAKTGALDGLWKGGKHGENTQTTSATNQCHDITVYSAMGLAAGACSGNGILLDIKDVTKPVRIDAVSDPNYAFWHSANFNNAGTKVLFTDEWGGGGQPRCRVTDPMNWGADAIFELKNRKLTLESYYKMPAPQTEFENCVAHNGSLVPVPGRDILVQSWYQGGISMVDFTDATHPYEIAYFDRGPIDPGHRNTGGMWSTYWYNGYIYSSEITRGVDVLKMVPSKFITQAEIDAANQVHFDELNVQNQPHVAWPKNFIVAKAYIDQLARDNGLSSQKLAAVNAAIAKGDKKEYKSMASSLNKDANSSKVPADADRLKELSAIFSAQAGL